MGIDQLHLSFDMDFLLVVEYHAATLRVLPLQDHLKLRAFSFLSSLMRERVPVLVRGGDHPFLSFSEKFFAMSEFLLEPHVAI